MITSAPISQPDPVVVEGAGIVAVILIGLGILFGLAAYILLIVVPQCKILKKAGEAWWKALIPLYSAWIQIKISGLAWWWFPIFVGLAGFTLKTDAPSYVASIGLLLVEFNIYYNLAKKFGKSNGFAVLCTLLPFIGLPILGFGKAEYKKSAKVDPNGIFSIEEK